MLQQMNEPSNATEMNLNLKLWFLSSYFVRFFPSFALCGPSSSSFCSSLSVCLFIWKEICPAVPCSIFSPPLFKNPSYYTLQSLSPGLTASAQLLHPLDLPSIPTTAAKSSSKQICTSRMKNIQFIYLLFTTYFSRPIPSSFVICVCVCVHINLHSLCNSNIASTKLKLICMQLLIEQKIAFYVNGNHF